jgi:hypothetical protein
MGWTALHFPIVDSSYFGILLAFCTAPAKESFTPAFIHAHFKNTSHKHYPDAPHERIPDVLADRLT